MRPFTRSVVATLACVAATGRATVSRAVGGPASTGNAGPDSSTCLAAFDSVRAVVRRDYAGYAEKARGHERALAALGDRVRAAAAQSPDDPSVCVGQVIHGWTGFFRDPHLMVFQAAPPRPGHALDAVPGTDPAGVDDANRPTLRALDDSALVLRLPSLEPRYKPALDSAVAANRARLLASPYLVVDVRGNGGGATATYDALVPFLYGAPYRTDELEVWATPANVAYYRRMAATAGLPEATRAEIRRALVRMEAALREAPAGRFVPLTDGEAVVRRDTVYPNPRVVALLVDGGCASSCEDLALTVRQSPKGVVVGAAPTAGVYDYGNLRPVPLPGWRRLLLPTARSRGRIAGRLDNVGVAPDVRVPAGTVDTVAFARRAAGAATRAPERQRPSRIGSGP